MTMLNPSQIAIGCMLLFIFLSSAGAQSKGGDELRTLIAVPEKPKAPDFKLTDTKGQEHTLEGHQGEVVILNFWATWCAPCRKEMPSMQRAWEKTRDSGVVLLAANWGDSAEAVDMFIESIPVDIDFPVLLGADRDMTSEWGVKGLPTTFIIDPQGRIAYRVAGELEWDDPEVLDKVLALKEASKEAS